jgi:hypothetical protein
VHCTDCRSTTSTLKCTERLDNCTAQIENKQQTALPSPSLTFQLTRLATSSWSTSTSLRMMWGAPLVHLKVRPSAALSVPSVRLMVGSKGRKSTCGRYGRQRRMQRDRPFVREAAACYKMQMCKLMDGGSQSGCTAQSSAVRGFAMQSTEWLRYSQPFPATPLHPTNSSCCYPIRSRSLFGRVYAGF